jgi:hypothetical protein
MASIIFLSPDFTFTKELHERFKSMGNKDRLSRYVSVQMEDRLRGLLKKETEIIEKEFLASLKNKRGLDSKKSVKVITSLENFYKNADSIIKNSKIIIVSDLETRKLFRKKSSPGGVNRDTFIARLIKVGERNNITIKSYLLLYKYDVDKVLNESSFSDLVSNTREQYVKSSEFGAGFKTQVDKGDKSSFLDYDLADVLRSAPAGVSEFKGVADVLKKEEEADEETTINELIQIQKKAKVNAKILFTPTGNMVKDLKIAIVNKLLIKIKYVSDNKSEELATGVRLIEPVALGQSKKNPAKGLAIRAWLKKGDTNNPQDRPGWRFLYVSNIKSIEFTGDVFNFKRPSYNSAGDKWMSSISVIASFDTTRIYGKGRRAEIYTSTVQTLSMLISSSSGPQLRSYVKKLKEIKKNHESGKQVLGYADRELLYSYFT